MESSDDEEIVPQVVTNYYLVDNDESPISFSVLPVHFAEDDQQGAVGKAVFLHGTSDGGLQKVYKQVVAWKLGLKDEKPNISVLSKDKKWITLLNPRRSYHEDTIRTIMITVHLLHFLRIKPQASEKSLWEHLRRVFGNFEVRPDTDDVIKHLSLIKLFKERDEVLANSQLLLGFLEGKPRKKFGEDALDNLDLKQSFIVADGEVDEDKKEDVEDGDKSEADEDSDLFDSVCAICDNGGDILICEGPCLRSFHPTRITGEESSCKSLGYTTKAEVDSIQNFLCKNCLYKKHQCFCCGKLGSSDPKGAEVYPCVSATCGHFYHPKCVADLLFPGSEAEASEFQKRIIAGELFTCPVHKCVVCKQGENKEDSDLQFAMCRRCPKSYHRKCLPRRIAFEDIEEEDTIQRAWDGLLPGRILIYCLEHEIDEEIGTPIRNHIIFPKDPEKKRISDVQKNKVKALAKKRNLSVGRMARDRITVKLEKLTSSEGNHSKEKVVRTITQHTLGSQKKESILKEKSSFELGKAKKTIHESTKITVKEEGPTTSTTTRPLEKIFKSSFPHIDRETEALALALFKKTSTSITLDDVTRKHVMPSTYSSSGKLFDKTITLGKVEASVEAIRTTLNKLENGGSLEDARAVCEPELLRQVLRWRDKLRVHLAPFLHGMRYTSYGRHFTKVDKLKDIVEKIQWYIQDGDTVVDFCCGANDFSILMKEKLDAVGKKCNYKNYDIIQPKNDFNFERRDWLTVKTNELPTGSKLIMGLNPPFGVKAALANKFIDKALLFKPKLIVLIVPEETQGLDKKKNPYDLIWKDGQSLAGKSFYLPGSVDENDKQLEQWNVSPPPLYLWSRYDWSMKHKEIAKRLGHLSTNQVVEPPAEQENRVEQENLIRDASSGGMQARKEDSKGCESSKKRASSENHNGGSCKRQKSSTKGNVSEESAHDETSDMSISPGQPESRNWSSHLPAETTGTSLVGASNQDVYSRSGTELITTTGGNDIFKDIVNDDIDEIARRYTSTAAGESMLNRNTHGWPSGGIESYDYGVLSSEPRFADYTRDSNTDSFSRCTYLSDVNGYGRQSEADLRAQIRVYGMQDQDEQYQRNRITLGALDAGLGQQSGLFNNSSSSHRPSPATGVTSAINRYAPRLDETNYLSPRNHVLVGPGNLVQPTGPFPGRSVTYEHNLHGMRRDMPPDSVGFASGPHPSFNHPGSSRGFIDDE
ncbi:protein ENHANCED DOWNY MILDEW 2 [Canna indica]|uniref:Protein ENHANCED DOWNY MILDEW 2 n=1 Tax=Canna indica TaxID=4628 RepID=A0AAQ3K2W2_9LILI|nr:protein ENHANCED DOWNY MILDEW 2 [Canna indica]